MKIGISFSGGSAKGAAHIGVIRALTENNIRGDVLYGTSAGSIAALMYASGCSADDMLKFASTTKILDLWQWRIPSKGLIPLSLLEKKMRPYVGCDLLEELPIETYIGVTNVLKGQHETISAGNAYRAVMASSCIPLLFQPVKINDQLYIDGGVSRNMPTALLSEKCDFVIGIDVVKTTPIPEKRIKGMKSVLDRSMEISLSYRTLADYENCDVVISPQGLGQFNNFDFAKSEEIHNIGYQHTLSVMDQLTDKLQEIKNKLVAR